MPVRQASRVMVRQQEQEVVMERFSMYIALVACTICLTTPALLGIQIWVLVEYFQYTDVTCDVPLQSWFWIICASTCLNMFVRQMARCLCGYPDPENPRPMPFPLLVYNMFMPPLIFGWNCLGVYWVFADGSWSEHPPCKEVATGLFNAVRVYSLFNTIFIALVWIALLGPMYVLVLLVRYGVLKSPDAAPKGTVNTVTTLVPNTDPSVVEIPECPICMEAFSGTKKLIVNTTCSHIYHKSCLQNWVERFNKTCPLCRKDLTT